jgi:hypothetical protein
MGFLIDGDIFVAELFLGVQYIFLSKGVRLKWRILSEV